MSVKRKRKPTKGEPASKKAATSVKDDVDIPSDGEAGEEDEEGMQTDARSEEVHDDEEVNETPEERKLRLAKKYLEEIEQVEKERLESQEIDKSLLEHRLDEEDAALLKRHKNVADKLRLPIESEEGFRSFKNGHRLSVTCACLSPDGRFLFSGGKEGSLVKWSFESGKRLHTIEAEKQKPGDEDESRVGHCRPLTSMAISSDGKFLATADGGKDVRIWNPEDMSLVHRFTRHRGPVTGVVFRRSTHTLYTCSQDRSVKVWDVDEQTYVESLFGHQEPITAIDSLVRERAVTAGGRDSTVRLWKIPEESQLVFQGSGLSIDCVKFLDEQHFISGGEDG